MKASINIDILVYDDEQRRFAPCVSIKHIGEEDDPKELSSEEASTLGITISDDWMSEYSSWNDFDERKGHPIFSSVDDLIRFNEKGNALVDKLRQELDDSAATVEQYRPVYSNIEVGTIAAWWHVMDKNYGFIVPIQQLPVSDELKSRLVVWRGRQKHDWHTGPAMESFNEEGRDLEQHLLWELNVLFLDDFEPKGLNRQTSWRSCDSLDSVLAPLTGLPVSRVP
jgi:hypothetical protein